MISFTVEKTEYVKALSICNGFYAEYGKGRTVKVTYDPDDPNDCEIANKMRLVSVPMIQVVAGFAIVSIGIFAFIMFIL